MIINETTLLELVSLARQRGQAADLHGHDLSRLGLYRADLSGCNFSGCDLGATNLS